MSPQSGMAGESDMWGWKHVTIYGGFDKGSGTKRWKCNHCHLRYNGSYSRVRAHLLGCTGIGIKGCPAVDRSMREAFLVLEEQRLARKKKRTLGNPITKHINQCLEGSHILSNPSRTISKEDVDDTVARFFYADGLDINSVNSPYFQEMVRALGSFGPGYEPPSVEKLSDSSLSKEKAKIERGIALVKESWAHTGCTILCVNRLDSALSCFCINFFVASPRGMVFLKDMDIYGGDGADHLFISILTDMILEVGPTNVLQVITHLGHASFAFEPVIVSKFPHIFWSHCASYSVSTLMEEIAEMGRMKNVVMCAKEIEQFISTYPYQIMDNIKEYSNPLGLKFAPYATVHKICWMKQVLQLLVNSVEWKQWALNHPEGTLNYETSILDEDFWERAHLMLQLFEPLLTLLSTINIDKSVMGDIYNWRIQSLEVLRSKGIDNIVLNQMELLIESKWDMLFPPLQAVGYILNPKYFGNEQSKDKNAMRGWKATIARYESDNSARRVLREQLSSYWRSEGSLGEDDAVDSRDKMDPVAWWENFGFETPQLQTLAMKVLSQVSSVSVCDDSWLCKDSWICKDLPCRKSVIDLGVNNAEDLVFVKNNLRLQSSKNGNGNGNGNTGCLSTSRKASSCCAPCNGA